MTRGGRAFSRSQFLKKMFFNGHWYNRALAKRYPSANIGETIGARDEIRGSKIGAQEPKEALEAPSEETS